MKGNRHDLVQGSCGHDDGMLKPPQTEEASGLTKVTAARGCVVVVVFIS